MFLFPSLGRMLCVCMLSVCLYACVTPGTETYEDASGAENPLKAGIAAYRTGKDEAAWAHLLPLANQRVVKAERYVAMMLLDNRAPQNGELEAQRQRAVAHLLSAARSGDTHSLIRLEALRAERPNEALSKEIIAIEKARAQSGDVVLAWRLARRYRHGDGTLIDPHQEEVWLRQVAKTASFLHTHDAENRLCEIYSDTNSRRKTAQAFAWCDKAAKNGNHAAAITLARMKAKQ